MELLLVQHGEAQSEHEDPARPLTDRGRDDVTRVAKALGRVGLPVAAIYHSGKLRAQQTAEILAAELGVEAGPSRIDGLAPNDDPRVVQRVVGKLDRTAALVGHLPHLSRLASLLLVGDATQEPIAFKMGGVVCLEREEEGRWRLRWMVVPDVFG